LLRIRLLARTAPAVICIGLFRKIMTSKTMVFDNVITVDSYRVWLRQ